MRPEIKYCKIISLTLLLFFVITIQHYSNKLIKTVVIIHTAEYASPKPLGPVKECNPAANQLTPVVEFDESTTISKSSCCLKRNAIKDS